MSLSLRSHDLLCGLGHGPQVSPKPNRREEKRLVEDQVSFLLGSSRISELFSLMVCWDGAYAPCSHHACILPAVPVLGLGSKNTNHP